MNKLFSAIFIFCTVTVFADFYTSPASPAQIVLPIEATDVEKNAAKEIIHYFEAMGIGTPTITESGETANSPCIYIGWSSIAEKLTGRTEASMAQDESIITVSNSNQLVLAGHPTRGTLYAVYRFLENYCGILWMSVDEEFVPQKEFLGLSTMNEAFIPAFTVRNPGGSQFSGDKSATDAVAAYNARLGKNWDRIDAAHGGGEFDHVLCGFSHTLERFVPDEAFFKSHPTYFGADEVFEGAKPESFALRNGRRLGASEGQPCMTNPENVDIAVKYISRLIHRKKTDYDVVWLTQNDNANYCQCPKCLEALASLGNQSDLLINFVNQVADKLNLEFPGLAVETFAYTYSLDAPKTIVPNEHVRIRLCLIEADAAHPLIHPINRRFYLALKNWTDICSHVNIWHYITNFTNMGFIHPNIHTIVEDFKLFHQMGIKEIFSQDSPECGRFSWFSIFRGFVNAHLMMNPELDFETLSSRFFEAYYGPAALSVRQLFDMYESTANESNNVMTCYQMDTYQWLPAELFKKGQALLDQARNAVEPGSTFAQRIAQIQFNQDWTLLWRHENTALRKLSGHEPLLDADAYASLRSGMPERLKAIVPTPGWRNTWTRLGTKYDVHLSQLDNYMAPEPKHELLPDSLKEVPEASLLIIPPERYSVTIGERNVKDSKAPWTYSTRLKFVNDYWCFRIDLPVVPDAGEWEILFEARLPDAVENPSGTAFICGLYDYGTNLEIKTEYPFDAADFSRDNYQLYSMGITDFHRDNQIYFSGINNPTVPELLLGRVYLRKLEK